MTFFAVTASIMAVSILLIYKLCRYFGLELKWISLVLCAVFAFGVNGATILLSPFLTQGHYLRLAVLVLIAAAMVTLVNEYLLKRERKRQLATADGTVLTLEEEPETAEAAGAEMLLADSSEAGETNGAGEELSQRLHEAMKANTPPPEAEPVLQAADTQAEETAAAPAEEAPVEETPVTEAETAEAAELAEAAGTAAEAVEETGEAEAAAKEAPAETAPVETEEIAPETEAEAPAEVPEETAAAPEEAAEPAETGAEEPAEQQEEPPAAAESAPEPVKENLPDLQDESDAAEAAVAELGTLDEILDYAYSHKEKEPNAAIIAYQAAIDRYPEDSYTPFLIIELAGLYKERASYSEAINLYAESLGMPIIAGDDAMVQEFSKTLRYLGTVQDILSKHHALATPFSKLTPEILQEIEEEFAKRQAK